MRLLFSRRRLALLIAVPMAAFLCLTSAASADRSNNPNVVTNGSDDELERRG